MATENITAQAPAISVTHMVNPALHAGIQFAKADFPGLVEVEVMFQPPGEINGIAAFQTAVSGINHKT